jgi:hypothetical protein
LADISHLPITNLCFSMADLALPTLIHRHWAGQNLSGDRFTSSVTSRFGHFT